MTRRAPSGHWRTERWLNDSQRLMNQSIMASSRLRKGTIKPQEWKILCGRYIVVFARPDQGELRAVKEILRCFEDASGLEVNYLKSLAAPIRCDEDTRAAVAPTLACPSSSLPMPYVGLPLSLRKPTKADLQPVLDKLANKLVFWKARLMSREGRVAYVRAVMAASVVYLPCW
jgi:hypothetical protein